MPGAGWSAVRAAADKVSMIRALLWCLLVAACARGPDRDHVDALFAVDARPIPARADESQRALGERLFAARLGAAACADCHDPARHFQDGRVHERNTPSLRDVGRQSVLGWAGEAADLVAMVERELERRCGLGGGAAAVPGGETMSRAQVAAALVAYLESLRTTANFDRYVEGDDDALSSAAKAGLATFVEVGCAACHGTRNLGGRSMHAVGIARRVAFADEGRAAATKRPEDRFVFKAPMLRHAVSTPPYLHDGSIATLREAIAFMATHELGRELGEAQVASIEAFLVEVAGLDGTGR